MSRLIDADMLRDAMFHYYGCVNDGTDKSNYKGETLMNYEVADLIEDCIDNAPTIDAEPVVRCRDCKHYGVKTVAYIYETGERIAVCGKHPYGVPVNNPNWFCADGERKEE